MFFGSFSYLVGVQAEVYLWDSKPGYNGANMFGLLWAKNTGIAKILGYIKGTLQFC